MAEMQGGAACEGSGRRSDPSSTSRRGRWREGRFLYSRRTLTTAKRGGPPHPPPPPGDGENAFDHSRTFATFINTWPLEDRSVARGSERGGPRGGKGSGRVTRRALVPFHR